MKSRVLSMLAIVAVFCCGIAEAQIPRKLNYQGFLTSPSGAPINSAGLQMVFNIYNVQTLGSPLHTETQTVTVSNGIFNVLLGTSTALTLPFDAQYYLGVTPGLDSEMSPRQPFAASPYTIRAATADSADALATGGAVGQVLAGTGGAPAWTGSPALSGNLSVGSASAAAARLDVSGSGWFRADGNALPASAAQGVRLFYDTFSGSGNMYAYDYTAVGPLNLTLQSPGGNVAIGNTTPTSKLTVAGRIETTSGGVKFPDGTTQLTALSAVKAKNTLLVSPAGGNFTTISAALTSIADNTASNRYVIYVGPGTYAEQVTMKEYVDLQGAGELVTSITGVGNVSSQTGTVMGASNAELRFLAVENTGGNLYAVAIYNNAASPRLTHVTASAFGGGNLSVGVLNNASSSPTMNQVTASATGSTPGTVNAGVYNSDSSPTIGNSVISASGGGINWGIRNSGSAPGTYTVQVNHSRIIAATSTIANDNLFVTRVGASQLSGGPAGTQFGTMVCAGVYDEAYMFFASTCP